MEVKIEYNGRLDREQKVKATEAQQLRMISDDFYSDWKTGEEPRGTMTFTDVAAPMVASIDWQADWDKAVDKDKINIVARMVGLNVP